MSVDSIGLTAGDRRYSVSLCMIVRDEAENLTACLGPVRELFDEIIVVDTGSSDATREIAARFHAKVVDFPWIDDFSAARNESFRQATGDYVFWLDADDRLESKDVQQLQRLFRTLDGKAAAYMMVTACKVSPEVGAPFVLTHPRLIRADRLLAWRYRVHEQIMPSLEELGYEVRWTEAQIQIQHEGYTDGAMMRRKANRDLRLLLLDYLICPYDPCILYHLGKAYARLLNYSQSLVYLLRSLHYVSPQSGWAARLYSDIVRIMVTLGRKKEALAMVAQGLSYHPSNPALLRHQAELLADGGELQAAERILHRLLALPQHDYLTNDLPAAETLRRNRRMLGSLYLHQNRLSEAEHVFEQIIAEDPTDAEAGVMLGYVYLQRRCLPSAEAMAQQLQQVPQGEAFAACVRAEIAKIERNLPAAREHADQACRLAPHLLLARLLFAEVLDLLHADVGHRRRALNEVLRISPDNAFARRALNALDHSAQTLDMRLFNGVAVASSSQSQV